MLTWHVDNHLLSSSVANVSSEVARDKTDANEMGVFACGM